MRTRKLGGFADRTGSWAILGKHPGSTRTIAMDRAPLLTNAVEAGNFHWWIWSDRVGIGGVGGDGGQSLDCHLHTAYIVSVATK